MSKKKKDPHILCDLSELEDPGSKGFEVKIKRKTRPIFVVRKNNAVYAYENSCPHAHAPLEWLPDQFLSDNKDYIVCAMHGAEFSIEEGACLGGPCNGEPLTPIKVAIDDDKVVLTE